MNNKHNYLPIRDLGIPWNKKVSSCLAFCYPYPGVQSSGFNKPFMVSGEFSKVAVALKQLKVPMIIHFDIYDQLGKMYKSYGIYGLAEEYVVSPILLSRNNPYSPFNNKYPNSRYNITIRKMIDGEILTHYRLRQMPRKWMKELDCFLDKSVIVKALVDNSGSMGGSPFALDEQHKKELKDILDKINKVATASFDINALIDSQIKMDEEKAKLEEPIEFKFQKNREINDKEKSKFSIPNIATKSMKKILQEHEIIPLTPEQEAIKIKRNRTRSSMVGMLKKTGVI